MQARVRFYGNYRRFVREPEVILDLADAATALDLARGLVERCGEPLRATLLTEKNGTVRFQAGVRISVAGDIIDFSSDLDVPLMSHAETREVPIQVFVFPPLMGGT